MVFSIKQCAESIQNYMLYTIVRYSERPVLI